MLYWIRTLLAWAEADAFRAYRPALERLPRAAVPLAHALVHAVGGIDDDLRRWLDIALTARAPAQLGQPASRAVVGVWHALQDDRMGVFPVAADADWVLLRMLQREQAALDAIDFVLRIHWVTVQQRRPGAAEAVPALASPARVPGGSVRPATTRSSARNRTPWS